MYLTRPGWTKARMIEKIRQHVPDEGCMIEGDCIYERPDGKRCALGSFLPDDHPALDPSYQAGAANLIDEHENGELPDWAPLDVHGLDSMQFVHDSRAQDEAIAYGVIETVVRWIEANVTETAQ